MRVSRALRPPPAVQVLDPDRNSRRDSDLRPDREPDTATGTDSDSDTGADPELLAALPQGVRGSVSLAW